MVEEKSTLSDMLKAYEDGKHRRYNLLFAVNGGAFAVAKLFSEADDLSVLGGLTLSRLSFGMILFSAVMVLDIFTFGEKMRKGPPPIPVFSRIGKAVLLFIGLLIGSGWFLVGFHAPPSFAAVGERPDIEVLCSSCGIPQAAGVPHIVLLELGTGEVWAYKDLDQQPVSLGRFTRIGAPLER